LPEDEFDKTIEAIRGLKLELEKLRKNLELLFEIMKKALQERVERTETVA